MIPPKVGNSPQPTAIAAYAGVIPATTTDSRGEQGEQANGPLVVDKPKKRKASGSPTQRSLAHMREQGCRAEVTEHWNPFARRRVDLFGFVDVLALHPDGTTFAIQTTSGSNVSARVRKITDECATALAFARACGWRIVVHGWAKRKPRGAKVARWTLREVDIS